MTNATDLQPLNAVDPGLVGLTATLTYGDGTVNYGKILGYEMGEIRPPYLGEPAPPATVVPFLLVDFGGEQAGRIPVENNVLPAHVRVLFDAETFDVTGDQDFTDWLLSD